MVFAGAVQPKAPPPHGRVWRLQTLLPLHPGSGSNDAGLGSEQHCPVWLCRYLRRKEVGYFANPLRTAGWLCWTWDTYEQPFLFSMMEDGGVIASALQQVQGS
jgi:hypothetical protein